MLKVGVPATTANIGSGYDVLGLALQLYNIYQIERIPYGIEIEGWPADTPLEENLIYNTIKKALEIYGQQPRNIRISTRANIPTSRGLGSSAACIIGGLMLANYLLDGIMSKQDIIQIGTQMEGHPDNIVPAVVGGMTVSIYEGGQVIYSKVNIPANLQFAVMIPSFSLSTYEARKMVPNEYMQQDCIFNIGRVAMLVAAMNNGEIEKLRIATEDKIHQPYREKLIPGMSKIFDMARNLGSKAEMISGSGSTLLAIIDEQNIDFETAIKEALRQVEGNWEIKLLKPALDGASYCK